MHPSSTKSDWLLLIVSCEFWFALSCRTYQIARQVIQISGAQPRRVVNGHERFVFQALDIGLKKEMECSVERLQLQREIIFVAYPACILLTPTNDDHRALCLTIRSLAGLRDRISNLLDRMGTPVAGQIGSDKSAVARNHVAGGTAGIPVEQGLPVHRIAG